MSARNDLIESLGLPGRDPRPGWAVAALDQQRLHIGRRAARRGL